MEVKYLYWHRDGSERFRGRMKPSELQMGYLEPPDPPYTLTWWYYWTAVLCPHFVQSAPSLCFVQDAWFFRGWTLRSPCPPSALWWRELRQGCGCLQMFWNIMKSSVKNITHLKYIINVLFFDFGRSKKSFVFFFFWFCQIWK